MKAAPNFSIVVPVLNAERFLTDAIVSVLDQTISDWEMILVDDGSADSGPRICLEWAAREKRISFLPSRFDQPTGAAAARNRGIAMARGTYLVFLDADDLFLPERLEAHLAILTEQPDLPAVYSRTVWFHHQNGEFEREYLGALVNRTVAPPELLRRVLLRHEGDVPCTCSITLRRSEVLQVGGFDEGFTLYEDQTLWVKMFSRFPCFVSDRCLAVYRQHDASISAEASRQNEYHRHKPHSAGLAFLRWVGDYLTRENLDSPDLRRELRFQQLASGPPGMLRRILVYGWRVARWLKKRLI